MKIKVVTAFISALLFLLMLNSCRSDNFQDLLNINPNPCDTVLAVSYSNEVVPVLAFNCYACHNLNSHQIVGGGIRLDEYNALKTYVENGKLLCSIQHGNGCLPMPQGGGKLAQSDIEKIQIWICNGALED